MAASQSEVIQLKIPADPKYVSAVRRAIQSIARSLDLADDAVTDIEICIAEALANAVEHGSPKGGESAVVVMCRITDDCLTIDVRDEGPGFEPYPADEQEPMSEHGRGLRIIHNLMDQVKVSRSTRGSRIRMVKSKDRSEDEPRTAAASR